MRLFVCCLRPAAPTARLPVVWHDPICRHNFPANISLPFACRSGIPGPHPMLVNVWVWVCARLRTYGGNVELCLFACRIVCVTMRLHIASMQRHMSSKAKSGRWDFPSPQVYLCSFAFRLFANGENVVCEVDWSDCFLGFLVDFSTTPLHMQACPGTFPVLYNK